MGEPAKEEAGEGVTDDAREARKHGRFCDRVVSSNLHAAGGPLCRPRNFLQHPPATWTTRRSCWPTPRRDIPARQCGGGVLLASTQHHHHRLWLLLQGWAASFGPQNAASSKSFSLSRLHEQPQRRYGQLWPGSRCVGAVLPTSTTAAIAAQREASMEAPATGCVTFPRFLRLPRVCLSASG